VFVNVQNWLIMICGRTKAELKLISKFMLQDFSTDGSARITAGDMPNTDLAELISTGDPLYPQL